MDAPHLVHSAQRVEQLRPWPAEGVVTTQAQLQGIFNMRIGALVQVETASSVGGEVCARTLWSLFIPGVKADDHGRAPPLLRTRPPKDVAPAFSATWETSPAQALLYRLNGDLNPIHARPETAEKAGFEQPILHGLCTYGWAAWTALKHLAGDDPARFRRFEARFTRPVLPGQTLIAEGYPLSPGSAAVTVRIKETDELAIAHGLFEYEVDGDA
jgi:acyl dehydratase